MHQMLSRAMTRVGLLLLGIPAGLVSLPADLAGQDPTVQPPATISVWIEEARAGPFHGLIAVGTPENPSMESAVAVSGGTRHGPAPVTWLRRPIVSASQIPDSAISTKHLFGYTLLAATIPMIPAMILSEGDRVHLDYSYLTALVYGALVTTVSVPVAARLAGARSLSRILVGTALGCGAGFLSAGLVAHSRSGPESWIFPSVFSLTLASVTTMIAPRPASAR